MENFTDWKVSSPLPPKMSKRVNFSEYEKQIILTYVEEYAHIIEDLKICEFFPRSSLGNRIQKYMELDHTSCTLFL